MFLDDLGLKESGVTQLIKAAYRLLNLYLLYCWRARSTCLDNYTSFTAPQAAGVIHTDFEKASYVLKYKYDDFVKFGPKQPVKKMVN